MAVLSGLHAGTEKFLQLDAGVLLTGITTDELENTQNWSSTLKKGLLGATKGGASFTATPEFRSLLDGVNGARGNYKDGQVIDSWDISLKATISEMTKTNIMLAMGGKVSDITEHKLLSKHKASVGVVPSDHFISSVVWAGKIAGKEAPMFIYLKDVLNVNGVNFTAEDKNTGSIELELKAHFNVANPDEVPFYIYTSNAGGDV